ncbi:MAG: hypothetical protein KAH25_00205, partial [Bacteroidales bacterium]|nr:hypothetical protein [Bacteroidales bacterium]
MKILKIIGRVLGVLLIIISITTYFSVSYVDTTPYFETEYYKTTIERLKKAEADLDTASGNLFAGFARINITPQITTETQHPEKG